MCEDGLVYLHLHEQPFIFQYNFKFYSIKAYTFLARFITDVLSIVFFSE